MVVIIVCSCIAFIVAIVALSVLYYYLFPIKIKVNLNAIKPIGSRLVVKKRDGDQPTSIYIPDSMGNVSSMPLKILAFTDMHFDKNRKQGYYTMKYLIQNIQIEKPDLVVFVGDVVTAQSSRARVHQFSKAMEKLEVYWIAILGNHEGDKVHCYSRAEFIDIYSSCAHCLTENEQKHTSNGSVVWGNGNTQINVLTEGGKVSQALFFIDSGDRISAEDAEKYGFAGSLNKTNDYDYVKPSQIAWYKERIGLLDKGVKSLLFLHIPLPEYAEAVEACPKDDNGKLNIGIVGQDGTLATVGAIRESVCGSLHNSGLFNTILQLKSTQAVIAGHDHANDFRIRYKGVWLCYNRMSGYSSYNVLSRKLDTKLIQGASIYTIQANGNVDFGEVINSERFDDSKVFKLLKNKTK